MDIILYSLKSLFPILIPITLGYFIRLMKWMDENSFKQVNGMIFKTLLPLLIFMNIYKTDQLGAIPVRELGFAILTVMLVFFISWLFMAKVVKKRALRGILVQSTFRSNFVIYGVPLTAMLLEGQSSGLTEILIALIIPLYNLLAVFILSYYSGQKFQITTVLKRILTNPLILASVLAVLFKNFNLEIPSLLFPALDSLAKVATPLSLLVLGGQFYFSSGKTYLRYLIPAILARLVLVPAIALSAAVSLGFSSEALIAFLALFASPAAVSSYTMAQQMCDDAELSAQILVYSSLFSGLSLFVFIAVGRAMALL